MANFKSKLEEFCYLFKNVCSTLSENADVCEDLLFVSVIYSIIINDLFCPVIRQRKQFEDINLGFENCDVYFELSQHASHSLILIIMC